MSAKFTPGKWEVVRVHGAPLGVGVYSGPIAQMVANTMFDGDKEKDMARRGADARLIAAAPDLLEACIKMRATDGTHGVYDAHGVLLAGEMMDAAIAKADPRRNSAARTGEPTTSSIRGAAQVGSPKSSKNG